MKTTINVIIATLFVLFTACGNKDRVYTNTSTEVISGGDFQTIHKICMRMVERQGTAGKAEYEQHGDTEIIAREWAIGENGKEYFSRKIQLRTVQDGVKIEVSSDWTDKYAKDSNEGFIFIVKDDLKKVKSGDLSL